MTAATPTRARRRPPPHRRRALLLGAGLLFLLLAPARAATVVVGEAPRQSVTAALTLLADPAGGLDAAAAAGQPERFRPAASPALGYTSAVLWLRLTVVNRGPEPLTRWLAVGHQRLQSVTLYRQENGVWRGSESGTAVPVSRKPVPAVLPVLPLALAPGERRELLLRLRSETSITLDATLWQPTAYLTWEGTHQLAGVLALGGSLLAVFLALVVYGLLRERPYLYFATLELAAAVLELAREGLLQRYLWPVDAPFWLPLILVAGAGALWSMLLLVSRFLDLGALAPRLHRLLPWLAALIGVAMAVGLVEYRSGARLLSAAAVATMALCLAASILAVRRGDRAARFLILAFGTFWAMEGLRQLNNLGLLALPESLGFNASWSLLAATPLLMLALAGRTRELAAQLELARQMSRAKSEFLARVSHELRTPLNTIIGYAELLERGSSRLPPAEGLAAIRGSGQRLRALIDELLDEARLHVGRLAVEPAPFAVAPWLEELERDAGLLCGEADNTFRCRREGALPAAVEGDARRLRQCLDNLLGNANRHTRRGTITLRCGAEAAGPGRVRLWFAVGDTGPGIAPAAQQAIFEPFVQGEGGGRGGAGLGLAIVRELVRLMGGEVVVESTPGQGSTFRLYVEYPLLDGAAPEGPPTGQPGEPRGVGYRVLLVEDDPATARWLRMAFQGEGFETEEARGGDEAAAALRDRPEAFDAVVTDQFMAPGDGWAVLRHARDLAPALPVLLLSSAPPHPPAEAEGTLAFDRVLRKPVAGEELTGEVMGVIAAGGGGDLACSRPGPDALRRLRELVAGGEVTAIEEWARALAAEHYPQRAYARAVWLAARRLDFDALEAAAR